MVENLATFRATTTFATEELGNGLSEFIHASDLGYSGNNVADSLDGSKLGQHTAERYLVD